MEAHRRRLQEEHDKKAAEYAAKQAEVCLLLSIASACYYI